MNETAAVARVSALQYANADCRTCNLGFEYVKVGLTEIGHISYDSYDGLKYDTD